MNILLHRGRVFRRDYLNAVLAAAAREADHLVVTGDMTNGRSIIRAMPCAPGTTFTKLTLTDASRRSKRALSTRTGAPCVAWPIPQTSAFRQR
jgi:hypothetical protein